MALDDLPPFRASVMDGFAISTVEQATEEPYSVVKGLKSLAGTAPEETEEKSQVQASRKAVYVTTGAPVPSGYDAVVPIEQIAREGDEVI